MNRNIIQAGLTKRLYIRFARIRRRPSELIGVGTERSIDRIQRRCTPIPRDGMDEGISLGVIRESLDLGTEVMRMRPRSVNAMIDLADHDSEHFTLLTRQWRLGEHGCAVHFHRRFHHATVERHDLHDIPDAALARHRVFQFLFDQTGGVVNLDLLDMGHGFVSLKQVGRLDAAGADEFGRVGIVRRDAGRGHGYVGFNFGGDFEIEREQLL